MDVKVAKCLKDLPSRLQTQELTTRKEIFKDLGELIEEGLQENIVKGVCKVLPVTLLRYTDAKSRSLPILFIKEAVLKHPEVVAKTINTALLENVLMWKNTSPTRSLAKHCLAALAWSQTAVSGCPGVLDTDGVKILELQSILVSVILSAGGGREKEKMTKLMKIMWKVENIRNSYVSGILGCEPSLHVLVLGAQLLGDIEPAGEQYKQLSSFLLDILIKNVLMSKSKPRSDLLGLLKPLIKSISHDEFKSNLLPAFNKYLLRSPEIALLGVASILESVSIDLSQYAAELGKTFASNLKSKDDGTREDAIKAMLALGLQSSNQEAVEGLVKQIFAVLGGSEGKVTVYEQKVSLLTAVGNLSTAPVSGSGMVLTAGVVAELFVKFLETEGHEGTLIVCLENLGRWSSKFSAEVPSTLLSWIQKAVGQKTSTSPVRCAYLQCLGSCLNPNSISSALSILPTLIQIVENAAKQTGQSPLVTEGVHAAACLVKLATVDTSVESKLDDVFPLFLDSNKPLFFNDKFLSNCGSSCLLSIGSICTTLLISFPTRLEGSKLKPVLKGLVYALLAHSSPVRRQVVQQVRRIGSTLGGPALLSSLLLEMGELVRDKPLTLDTPTRGEVVAGGDIAASDATPAGWVISVLTSLVPVEGTPEEKEELLFSTLVPAHLPLVAQIYPGLWLRMAKSLGLDASDFLLRHQSRIIQTVLQQMTECSAVGEELVKQLVSFCPGVLLPFILNNLNTVLVSRDLLTADVNDYQIYLTPAGELYDKSVIESSKNDSSSANIRRENKAYSYKEQMEELALRKELEEKRRKEGKLKKPELTSKQKEAMKAQLEKEAVIREKISGVLAVTNPAVDLFRAAVLGNPQAFAGDITELLPVVYKALQSPLIAKSLAEIFMELRHAVFTAEDETMAQTVAAVTLQVLKPAYELEFTWNSTELKTALKKSLEMLNKSCVPPVEEEEDDSSCPLSAPAFAYCFPLIKAGMNVHMLDHSVLTEGLELITEHTSLRGNDDESDMFHPKYLPRADILILILDVIAKTDGVVQQAAVKALIDASECASGESGCAHANEKEISVLLTSLQSDCDPVRDAGIRALLGMQNALPKDGSNELYAEVVRRVWVLRCDQLPENRELADQLWDLLKLSTIPGLSAQVLQDVAHPVGKVRSAAAESLAKLLSTDAELAGAALTQLLEMYEEKMIMTPPLVDSLGRIVEPAIDHWEPRTGIAIAIAKIAPYYNDFMVTQAVSFFVPKGLGDRVEAVRKEMLNAAIATIDLHGKDSVGDLLPVFEDFLDTAPDDSSYDTVRQSVVILMGSLARHLEKDNPKVRPIIAKLINALGTPSQSVQEAVANCLPPLVPSIKDEAPDIVNRLLNTLLTTENYGERKGAAYGLAGLIKGLGILALKQLDVMSKLTEALQDKKNHRHREGALLALSQLCSMLGRLFEPYIVHVLPHLLLCFGDANQFVRDATDDCAKAVMSKLSAHGVKLVLPSLLAALEEDQWRTKAGSIELLGAMAFCAPKQLSSCLPSIVPKLIEVLGDSHPKVQSAGAQALKQIGSVIRNPEIQAIVPVLLAALQDPSKKTSSCLQTLLNTKFVHFIDAPSLALIMPAVQRAFQDRSTETRKMAAQIIGNMYSLTDQKDLAPYLPGIIPGLKNSLLDPVPEVRAVSARALGAMVRGMGESSFEDLLPWLMSTLTSETSSVDRSGAAQGLAEVVGGLGVDKMHKLMPEIISTAERLDIAPHVKDGYIMLFIYFPGVFQQEFMQYIGEVVQPILRALADENEYVRETALKAGQRIVNLYADSAITLLLPQLEQGLFDDNWRIRYSSVQLLGDLLYKISGVSGKMTTETASEDDNFGTEASSTIITKLLGVERRNRVLAGLYMGRSDVALMVRQAALHVWKIIVSNTPRTLREILPTLFNLLLSCLASSSFDKRQVAARTLGDLVRKLGERVLPEIIPILEKGLRSEESDKRQGVCVGLSEILTSTSREMVMSFVDSLVPTVRRALCDKDPEVRVAAARTFDSLHTTVGAKALDDILPHMLEQLADPEQHENTLDGLRQVMAIKSRAVLPYLVPQLTAKPVNTKALSILASVAGEALNKHLAKILPALLASLSDSHGTQDEVQELQYCQAVILAVTDDIGVSYVMDILLDSCKSKDIATRRGSVTLLHGFCEQTKINFSEYVPQLLRSLILLFTDKDEGVLLEAWNALNAVTKTLDADAQRNHLHDVRQALRFAVSDMKEGYLLPGFCIAKGIAPVLPIFRESILNGTPEQKEAAAQGLGEVIKVTSAEALKTSVVHITGPLIRILGDRFVHTVKVAVLDTLAILLEKASSMLKPFLPQLQTTFLKALNDTNRTVRLKAGTALSHLVSIHTRPDPLFNELHTGLKTQHDDTTVRETYLQAMRGCVSGNGDKLSPTIRRGVTASLLSVVLTHSEDMTRLAAAGCLGSLVRWLPQEEQEPLLADLLIEEPGCDWTMKHGKSTAIFIILQESFDILYQESRIPKLIKIILGFLSSDRDAIACNGVRCSGLIISNCINKGEVVPVDLLTPFSRSINHQSSDVKELVASITSIIARREQDLLSQELLKMWVPMLVNGTKEKNPSVKSSSEIALVDILHMRQGPSGQQRVLSILDPGMRDSLQEVLSKSLSKIACQQDQGPPSIDNTILT